jgi:hypothetical protein
MASNHSFTGYSTTSFGPAMVGTFDFTPLFEDTILSIVPSAGLLLAVPPRLYFLRSQPRKVLLSPLHSQKVVCFPKVLLCLQRIKFRAAFPHRVYLDANSSLNSTCSEPVTSHSCYHRRICSNIVRCTRAVFAFPFRTRSFNQTFGYHQCLTPTYPSF